MSRRHNESFADALAALMRRRMHTVWAWATGPGRQTATTYGLRALHQLKRNLTARRLLSFPHLLVGFWVFIVLWGELWVFNNRVADCHWDHWEKWPKGAKPHHLIFVADPQIIDPHSYPGRPWPLNPLTVLITDNYLRRGYYALQKQLHPDSLFFLGDLFDGGREWKTRQGNFVDPQWGRGRSKNEKKLVEKWHRKYGDDFWLQEYARFGNIFFDNFNVAGEEPGAWQRGRKLVASLPGNHDLGFGAQVQLPVRNRFSAYFGDLNRVDVVGNHTIVSVDAVSLSAGTSDQKSIHNLRPIYGPVEEFLSDVKSTKRKAVQEELSWWYDIDLDLKFPHQAGELEKEDLRNFPRVDPGVGGADFPTILLTHVPLYRSPGTPCGPKREHWPPTKPGKGEKGPVIPDHRNAISVTGGYQYQNVLNEADSVKLIKSVGNVIHVFSGDDHDYCEIVHSDTKENVREITVKSMSMAMGVPTPGFMMASLYNPVDENGNPIPGSPESTLQTHLCLLPNQLHTYMNYIVFAVITLVLLIVRAFLVPVLNLTTFALEPEKPSTMLPIYKDKIDPPESFAVRTTSSGTSAHHLPSRLFATAPRNSRSPSPARWQSRRNRHAKRWGWGTDGGPRIHLDDNLYDIREKDKRLGGRKVLGVVGRELWTTMWRVAWMTLGLWAYLARRG
ncbi:Fc.00g023260.m01.CDS01 [Cosmosporella sp. VM-42]